MYAKTPLGGSAQVLEYLSRYTHRTAISNERVRLINGSHVVFTVRAMAKATNQVRSGWRAWMALSLFAASCCTSCPTDRSAFATRGAGKRLHRGQAGSGPCGFADACAQLAGAGNAPRPSWRGWPGSMWAGVRVAGWAGCASRRRGWVLGACLGQLVHWCPSAGGRRDGLARCDKLAAVCRAI